MNETEAVQCGKHTTAVLAYAGGSTDQILRMYFQSCWKMIYLVLNYKYAVTLFWQPNCSTFILAHLFLDENYAYIP